MSHRPFLRTATIVLVIASLTGGIFLARSAPGAGTAIAGPPDPNDASSGGDAGDAPHLALLLGDIRRDWRGNLTPTGFDADWYWLPPASAYCAQVETQVSFAGLVTLTSTPDRLRSVSREATPGTPASSALAGPAGSPPIFGVEPVSMRLSASSIGTQTGPHSPGHYSFTFLARTHEELDPQRDGESPEAGATMATAAALPQGCSAGALGGADLEDRYVFDVAAPRHVTVSFALASGDATARVLRPDGSVYGTLADGDVLVVYAETSGRWSVVVAAAQPTALVRLPLASRTADTMTIDSGYMLGVTEAEPQPCRPSCLR